MGYSYTLVFTVWALQLGFIWQAVLFNYMFKYNLNIQIIIIALTRLITVRGATLNFLHVFSLSIDIIYMYMEL